VYILVSIGLSILAIIVIPLVILLFRITIKWTQTEDKITEIAADLRDMIADKEKVHSELNQQMREDRAATDRRLRWLEENLWGKGKAS
jgi:hypothetical protein